MNFWTGACTAVLGLVAILCLLNLARNHLGLARYSTPWGPVVDFITLVASVGLIVGVVL